MIEEQRERKKGGNGEMMMEMMKGEWRTSGREDFRHEFAPSVPVPVAGNIVPHVSCPVVAEHEAMKPEFVIVIVAFGAEEEDDDEWLCPGLSMASLLLLLGEAGGRPAIACIASKYEAWKRERDRDKRYMNMKLCACDDEPNCVWGGRLAS